MHTKFKMLMAAVAAVVSLVSVNATVIDFESYAVGKVVSGVGAVNSDLTFSSVERSIVVTSSIPGPDFAGTKSASGTPFTGNPFRADFLISGVDSVSVVLGDYNADADNLYLSAYDSLNNLLTTATAYISSSVYGGPTLSISSATDIAYVLFGSTGVYNNSVYFDNFSYNKGQSVPEAGSSLALLGAGLIGLVAFRRKFKAVAR